MGGAATEVGPGTKTIAIESAYFEPAQVRRTRRRLNLTTEASYRFERGTDPSMPVRALRRAVECSRRLALARRGPARSSSAPTNCPREISLRWSRIGRVLGMEVPVAEVEHILTSLGFGARRCS